jgi:hypothetical protein
MVPTCSRSATRTTDCVLLSWAERNLGRYEHARTRRARAHARHHTTDFPNIDHRQKIHQPSPLFGVLRVCCCCVFVHKLQGEVTTAQVDTRTV